MKQATDNYKLFSHYATQLKSIHDVRARLKKDDKKEKWTFTSSNSKALSVSLTYYVGVEELMHGEIVVEVENTDCAYWHTAEDDIELYIAMAEAALKGDVAHNISPILRRKEVCFKVDDSWFCTKPAGNHGVHYVKPRKKLRTHP